MQKTLFIVVVILVLGAIAHALLDPGTQSAGSQDPRMPTEQEINLFTEALYQDRWDEFRKTLSWTEDSVFAYWGSRFPEPENRDLVMMQLLVFQRGYSSPQDSIWLAERVAYPDQPERADSVLSIHINTMYADFCPCGQGVLMPDRCLLECLPVRAIVRPGLKFLIDSLPVVQFGINRESDGFHWLTIRPHDTTETGLSEIIRALSSRDILWPDRYWYWDKTFNALCVLDIVDPPDGKHPKWHKHMIPFRDRLVMSYLEKKWNAFMRDYDRASLKKTVFSDIVWPLLFPSFLYSFLIAILLYYLIFWLKVVNTLSIVIWIVYALAYGVLWLIPGDQTMPAIMTDILWWSIGFVIMELAVFFTIVMSAATGLIPMPSTPGPFYFTYPYG